MEDEFDRMEEAGDTDNDIFEGNSAGAEDDRDSTISILSSSRAVGRCECPFGMGIDIGLDIDDEVDDEATGASGSDDLALLTATAGGAALKLLPLPAATLLTILGPIVGGLLLITLPRLSVSLSVSKRLRTLTSEPTLPFPFIIMVIISSGFSVSSELSGLQVPFPYPYELPLRTKGYGLAYGNVGAAPVVEVAATGIGSTFDEDALELEITALS